MPWKRAKALPPPDNSLFEACFRIQREACEAANRYIPLVVDNVCGAQKWVGRARWHYGSYYLWGDVPALMPITRKHVKVPTMGAGWYPPGHPKHVPGLAFNGHADRNLREGLKNPGFRFDGSGRSMQSESVDRHVKTPGRSLNKGASAKFGTHNMETAADIAEELGWKGSKSSARKAASAHIAKIPLPLARHIAAAWRP
jgi:hypothetical protein